MAKPKRISPPLSQHQAFWLATVAACVSAPLAGNLPLWLSLLVGTALTWRSWLVWRRIPLPPGWLINLAGLIGMIGVGVQYRSIFGKDPGVALLTLFLALKLFEMRSRRDAYAALLLALFLVLSRFFYSQSIVTGAITVLTGLIIVGAMLALNRDGQPVRKVLLQAGTLVAQAIPFMVLLFLFFPRIAAPLWGLPADAYSALSGLSDSMSPGAISQLSLSDEIAFRAKFAGPAPARENLYWRGPVLGGFDGRTWRISAAGFGPHLPYAPQGSTVDYEITLEPHNRHWLLALDLPGFVPPNGVATHEYQLVSKTPIRSRLRYAMRSYPVFQAGLDESPAVRQAALRLPVGFNPRARALAEDLRNRHRRDADIVAALLAHYRRAPFVYTLSPPPLGRNSIDEFLFDTRRGFCEHYASSFVFVMRAAGIPARVVTGYLGGEINPADGYLLVRQSDAHAWAEVWLPGEGWRRVDPTAAIAPSRIEQNLAAAVPAGDPLPLLIRPELEWLRQWRFQWEALSNRWNQWVLGYDPQRQLEFMRILGMSTPDWRAMTATLAALGGGVMLLLTLWTLRQWQRPDPITAQWHTFSQKLSRRGLGRQAWEGPLDYGQRITAHIPGKKTEIEAICSLYQQLRYGRVTPPSADSAPTPTPPEPAPKLLSELKRRIRAFDP